MRSPCVSARTVLCTGVVVVAGISSNVSKSESKLRSSVVELLLLAVELWWVARRL